MEGSNTGNSCLERLSSSGELVSIWSSVFNSCSMFRFKSTCVYACLRLFNISPRIAKAKRERKLTPVQNSHVNSTRCPAIIHPVPTAGEANIMAYNNIPPKDLTLIEDSLCSPGICIAIPPVCVLPKVKVTLSNAEVMETNQASPFPLQMPNTPLSRSMPANTAARTNPAIWNTIPN